MTDEQVLSRPAVERRAESFAKHITSRLWQEIPSAQNPYIAEQSRCHGYDILELMQKRTYTDVLYLLFRGELPSKDNKQLLETLFIGCINPGPRHPATRAAMNAGVAKTDPSHILPISLSILGGNHLGAAEVEASMRWLRKRSRNDPAKVAAEELQAYEAAQGLGDIHISPGFGRRFGSSDIIPKKIADQLLALPGDNKVLMWANQFTLALRDQQFGWLMPGVVAATLCDLGFHPRTGPGLFQLICAPGLLAHGVEMASKSLTDMPFLNDEDYFIEEK